MDFKEEQETENVVELPTKKGKLSSHDMITSLISAMERDPIAAMTTGILEERFEVVQEPNGTGVQAIIVAENGECKYLTPTHAAQILLNFVRSKIKKGWPITERICQEAFFQWISCRRPNCIKTPIQQIAFKSQDNLCWKKLDFDPSEKPTPIFDEILSRMSSPKEFQAFIGSIFVDDSDRSQFMWIHGQGANGKSRLLAFLQSVMGDNCSPQTAPTMATERWFKAGLIGKRLALFADCSNTKFTSSDLFKTLTGDDVHSVERKGLPLTNEILRPKFLFMSNEKPKVDGGAAGRRRALVVEIGSLRGDAIPARIYDRDLLAEAEGVIWGCLERYEEMTECRSEIRVGDSMKQGIEAAVSENDEEFETVVQKYFRIDHDSDQEDWVKPFVFMQTLKDQGCNNKERSGVKRYLTTKGVNKKAFWENKKKIDRYTYLVEIGGVSEGFGGVGGQGNMGAGVSREY